MGIGIAAVKKLLSDIDGLLKKQESTIVYSLQEESDLIAANVDRENVDLIIIRLYA